MPCSQGIPLHWWRLGGHAVTDTPTERESERERDLTARHAAYLLPQMQAHSIPGFRGPPAVSVRPDGQDKEVVFGERSVAMRARGGQPH